MAAPASLSGASDNNRVLEGYCRKLLEDTASLLSATSESLPLAAIIAFKRSSLKYCGKFSSFKPIEFLSLSSTEADDVVSHDKNSWAAGTKP